MKVLVVEDEELISDAVCEILEQEGWFTDAVYDGDDACYYIKEETYDVIILDIMLPEKDGIEVLKYMRSIGRVRRC